jgi:hypothetical protein
MLQPTEQAVIQLAKPITQLAVPPPILQPTEQIIIIQLAKLITQLAVPLPPPS